MVDATHKSFRADDRSYFSLLKKEIHNAVLKAGYSNKKIAEIDIIVSELTSNLAKYAVNGEILFSHFQQDESDYIEIICIDNGPGMADAQRMISDGLSTTNTLGHGLGSIKRLSDTFDIYSQRNWGTIVLSRVYKSDAEISRKLPPVNIKAIVLPKTGEETSGDGCYHIVTKTHVKVLLADGLGHGVEANKAVNEAVSAFKSCESNDPVEIIRVLHTHIRKTRGAVITVMVYDIKLKTWSSVGVGNISMKLVGSVLNKSCVPYNGIVGHNIPNTMKVQQFSRADCNLMILCSDGIKSRWEISKYPQLTKCDLSIIAAALYKDFARGTDDLSVLITKCN